jgi:hypothetical protein
MLCYQYFVPLEHILKSFPYHIWHLLWFIICQTLMTAHKYAATHNDTSVPDLLWQSCSRNRWVMLPFQFQNLYNDPDFLSTIWIICMLHIAACPVMLLLCGGCKHNYLDRTGPVVRPRKTGTRTLASSVHLKDQVCSWTGKKRLNPCFLGREGNWEKIGLVWGLNMRLIGWGAHSLAPHHEMHLCLVWNLCLVKPFQTVSPTG